MRFVFVVVLLTGMCWGQVSPEEAQKRLEARQASPEELRRQLDERTREVVALKKQVATLTAELQKAKADLAKHVASTQPVGDMTPEIAKAIENEDLVVGMTLAQAEQAMKSKGFKVEEVEGAVAYRWGRYSMVSKGTGGERRHSFTTVSVKERVGWITATFAGGKIVRVSRS